MPAERYARTPRKVKPRLRKVLIGIWLIAGVIAYATPWTYGLVVVLLATCIHFAATEEVASLEKR